MTYVDVCCLILSLLIFVQYFLKSSYFNWLLANTQTKKKKSKIWKAKITVAKLKKKPPIIAFVDRGTNFSFWIDPDSYMHFRQMQRKMFGKMLCLKSFTFRNNVPIRWHIWNCFSWPLLLSNQSLSIFAVHHVVVHDVFSAKIGQCTNTCVAFF